MVLWKETQQLPNWTNSGSPTQLLVNNKVITKPLQIANALNKECMEKPARILAALPPGRDPMPHFRQVAPSPAAELQFTGTTVAATYQELLHVRPTKSAATDSIIVMTIGFNCKFK